MHLVAKTTITTKNKGYGVAQRPSTKKTNCGTFVPDHAAFGIVIAAVAPVRLYPFITIHDCVTCGARETYYVGGWKKGNKAAKLRGFERSHRRPHKAEEDADKEART